MILKNGLIMDPGTNASYKADLHIRDGVIAKIGPDLSAAPSGECLDAEGFVVTVHGKGSFVTLANQQFMLEEKKKRAEFLGSALKISINGSQISLTTSEISLVFSVPLSSGLRPTQK